jgi:hypothetical protein
MLWIVLQMGFTDMICYRGIGNKNFNSFLMTGRSCKVNLIIWEEIPFCFPGITIEFEKIDAWLIFL